MSQKTLLERADNEQAHVEDTLRSEQLIFSFEHLTPECTCSGKTCNKCHTKKCHLAFAPDKRKKDGRYWDCRTCTSIRQAAYRRAHPEKQCINFHNYRASQEQ